MNRPRNWLLLLLAALAAAVIGTGTFTGGSSFFGSQTYTTELSLPSRPTPLVKHTPTPVVEKPCEGTPGPVKYYANVAQAAEHNSFGVSLDPSIKPFDESKDVKPDIHTVVTAALDSYCHDPARTRAVTGAAFPDWNGLHGSSDWATSRDKWISALNKLHTLPWNKATLEYHSEPPHTWTMMMKHGATHTDTPTTYIVRSRTAGWYLHVPIDTSNSLLLRIGCGGQPNFDLRGGYKTALTGIFPVS